MPDSRYRLHLCTLSTMKISVEVNGKTYEGSYSVDENDMVTVLLLPDWKLQRTALGCESAEVLARLMQDENELARLAAAARRVGTANAATAIARHLFDLAENRDDLGQAE